ncbi:carnitine O-acetyltransferase-like [Lethenteron reissneri]|uniref:carnitine O-acetyltransferase-like n=1 Tax=Lethenteron reissneri TaxID=7753 RepID=UPI002AB77EE6|nr:carnitine O-acetyltransferase-like [Lethenteron reissneri]XP_061427879.1 carnitine O-acetyltransferase-like [Lethenteron reissneri]
MLSLLRITVARPLNGLRIYGQPTVACLPSNSSSSHRDHEAPSRCFSGGPLLGPDPSPSPSTSADGSSLPRLPVPPLKQTLERYLRVLEPLVTPEELEYTRKLVAELARPGGLGEVLQSRLERKGRKTENWLLDWWVNTAYLECRTPLAVYSSPGVVMPRQNFRDTQGQLKFAAKLISGVLDFKHMLDTNSLPHGYFHGKPLCMNQYYQIFSSCRIPGPRRDTIVNYSRQNNPPTHITVAHNYTFFKLEVYHPNGDILTTGEIYQQLEKIWNSSIKTTKEPIGILTAEQRHRWGLGLNILLKDKLNKESSRVIQKGIFAVCLDGPMRCESNDLTMSQMAAQILHGGGSKANTGNRWFDKTLQFIIGEDGTCGLVYERALAEGVPIMRIADHAMAYCNKKEFIKCMTKEHLPIPTKLYFNINEEVKRMIESAKFHHDIQVGDLDIQCFVYTKFGNAFPKFHRLSPDGYIQMAIQLAYFRLHKELSVATESATTRMFHLGRTEEIRCTSMESLRFVETFDDANVSNEEKMQTMKVAVEAHKEYTQWAVNGQAIDRHLLGLKLQAIEDQYNIPELFMDTSYAIASHLKLSTSQVPGSMDAVMCYGPVVPDGYGVCYNPQNDRLNFSVTALNSCSQTHANLMAAEIEKALTDMHELLSSRSGDSPWEQAQW